MLSVLAFASAAGPGLAAANLLPSGGFEGSGSGTLTGWKGMRAVLTLRPDGRGGGHAARVARSAGCAHLLDRGGAEPGDGGCEAALPRARLPALRPAGTHRLPQAGRADRRRPGRRPGVGLPHRNRELGRLPTRQLYREAHRRRDLAARRPDLGGEGRGQLPGRRTHADGARLRRRRPHRSDGPDGAGRLGDEGRARVACGERQRGRGRVHRLPRGRRDRDRGGHGPHLLRRLGRGRQDLQLCGRRVRRLRQPVAPFGGGVGDDALAR